MGPVTALTRLRQSALEGVMQTCMFAAPANEHMLLDHTPSWENLTRFASLPHYPRGGKPIRLRGGPVVRLSVVHAGDRESAADALQMIRHGRGARQRRAQLGRGGFGSHRLENEARSMANAIVRSMTPGLRRSLRRADETA